MTSRFPLTLAVALALATTACQSSSAPAGTTPVVAAGEGTPASTAPVVTTLTGRAMVGSTPLANADVVVYDPIAHQDPAAPGAGGGLRLEYAKAAVKTGADGRFSLSLALKAGQAAEIYVSNGKLSVCGIVTGPNLAVRNAGPVALGADGLLLDQDSTTTASVMLSSLQAMGKAAAGSKKSADEVLALQAKALDVMAKNAGPTAAKLVALAGTADIAKSIAEHMVQADPRLSDPAAKRVVLATPLSPLLFVSPLALFAGVLYTVGVQPFIFTNLVGSYFASTLGQLTNVLGDDIQFLGGLHQNLQETQQEDEQTATNTQPDDTSSDDHTDDPGNSNTDNNSNSNNNTGGGTSGGSGGGGSSEQVIPTSLDLPASADASVAVTSGAVVDPPATSVQLHADP